MAPRKVNLTDRILDQALELGEASSWEAVHLHDIADQLDITLDEIRQHFPQKDDLVEAWFDRADQAVLGERASEEYLTLPGRERLQRVIMVWLDALVSHRSLTREMLAYKLGFGHIHLQVPGLMRISRTVQWFREAACLDATGIQRNLEESTLTAIYLMTFTCWLFDDTPDTRRTRVFLEQALQQWGTLGDFLKSGVCHSGNRNKTKPAHTGCCAVELPGQEP